MGIIIIIITTSEKLSVLFIKLSRVKLNKLSLNDCNNDYTVWCLPVTFPTSLKPLTGDGRAPFVTTRTAVIVDKCSKPRKRKYNSIEGGEVLRRKIQESVHLESVGT